MAVAIGGLICMLLAYVGLALAAIRQHPALVDHLRIEVGLSAIAGANDTAIAISLGPGAPHRAAAMRSSRAMAGFWPQPPRLPVLAAMLAALRRVNAFQAERLIPNLHAIAGDSACTEARKLDTV